MAKATIALTFPGCVNRGDGPCEAWRHLAGVYKENVAEYERLQGEVERLREDKERAWDYASNLQRMIQRHCKGNVIEPELADKSPFLAGEMNQALQTKNTPQFVGIDYGKDESVTAYRCTHCKQVFVNEPPETHECVTEKDNA